MYVNREAEVNKRTAAAEISVALGCDGLLPSVMVYAKRPKNSPQSYFSALRKCLAITPLKADLYFKSFPKDG